MSTMIPCPPPKRPLSQRGITLVEVLLAIGIMGLVTAGAYYLIDDYMQRMRVAAAAQHMKIFADGVQAYIKDNYAAISTTTPPNTIKVPMASATTPAVITPWTLQHTPQPPNNNSAVSTKYLPSGFSEKNAYGQSLCALVLQPKPNELYALVVSVSDPGNNKPINDVDLGLLTGTLGAAGGAIYEKSGFAAVSLEVKGTMGRWGFNLGLRNPASNPILNNTIADAIGRHFRRNNGTVPGCLGNFVLAQPRLEAGHPVMALWYAKDTSSAFLYRNEVPGHPELNEMQTDIRFKKDFVDAYGKLTPGASVSIEVEREADTLCDAKPTSKQGYKDKFGMTQPGVPPGTLARDKDGNLMMCAVHPINAGGDGQRYWRTVAKAMYWGDPVRTYSDLQRVPCSASKNAYQTRIVKNPSNRLTTIASTPRAYTCQPKLIGGEWQALSVDDRGVLSTDLLKLGFDSRYRNGGNCAGVGIGTVTRDAYGQLLVCTMAQNQLGIPTPIWKGTAGIGRYSFQVPGFPNDHFLGTGHMTTGGLFSGTLYCNSSAHGWACGSGGTINCASSGYCTRYFAMRGLTAGWWGWTLDPMNKPMVVDVTDLAVSPGFSRQW